jgi:hypothetical protein
VGSWALLTAALHVLVAEPVGPRPGGVAESPVAVTSTTSATVGVAARVATDRPAVLRATRTSSAIVAGRPSTVTLGLEGVDGPRASGQAPRGPSSRAAAQLPGPQPPRLRVVPRVELVEAQALELLVALRGASGPEHVVFAEGLPPGARFDRARRVLEFVPDAFQGGRTSTVTFSLYARGQVLDVARTRIVVRDTIRTVEPTIVRVDDRGDRLRIVLSQVTDALTSHGPWLGKRYEARLCVPKAARADARMPLRVFLHGADAVLWDRCEANELGLFPSDTDLSYWWGYGYPDPPEPYTARRVLALVDWVLRTHPGADPARVYLVGASMGGAGALTLGLLHPRHFALIEAEWAQTIPRHQRPGRLRGLEQLWGSPPTALDPAGRNPFDLQDVTRILAHDRAARELPVFLRHAKDDPVIHFGAAVTPSPLTGRSAYEAFTEARVAHVAVWDEGGHGPPDPVLGRRWWSDGYDPIHDARTFHRVDLAFVAFSRSSADDDAGDGRARDGRAFDPSAGYAGRVERPGDTGWTGALAGAHNRWLRFDARAIVDTPARFEVTLHLADGKGAEPPRPGYPTRGDRRPSPSPIVADVSIRRVQGFVTGPGEVVDVRYGSLVTTVVADADGLVTVPRLPVGDAPTRLVVSRRWP